MKYLKQFTVILAVSLVGEILHALIPLPIPAGIYGLILMFLALEFKVIPLSAVKDTASYLLEIMPVMFIPAAVGIIDSWGLIADRWLSCVVITVVTTVLVMGVSGTVTQLFIRKSEKSEDGHA